MRIVLAAFLSLAAIPAQAADLATLDCVSTKLDAAVRGQIESEATAALVETGKRLTYSPAVGQGLGTAAKACAAEHKWTSAAAKAAGFYALAKIGLPLARKAVEEKGFDASALEDQFQALPEDKRTRVLTAQDTQALVQAAVTEESQQTRANAELLAEYFSFLSTAHYAAHDFSAA
ncbi:hypothetical protein [Sphingomonas xinjiangensis]|uniref:Uncharacterized protein n=1 Tax=Sphingomonas xinjiangensis TaxID=643568 RepID=A0A840YBZ1_9SPHN|nr:hypothetical protein [Sphingomonas xinjiangensis]MBB5710867.1 hypothetical protein [Sphingomonas xinjiangensis]